ncbi:hypothetical protein [uncultured Stenotrophomonas sp.]|uniref:hypothetical protein n=1 Tax=uncultured Stenotrophomonas sp. TaxID=165438 RepID=UPI0028F11C03|nr:hypothetical protein [uncultured Stenotrophomonas sp.]
MEIPAATFNMLLWHFLEEALILVWVTSPVWWAALKTLIRRTALPRPLLFVATSAALAYGVTGAAYALLLVPATVAGTFLAPQMQEAGVPGGGLLTTIKSTVTGAFVLLAASLPISAWWGSRRLAQRWQRLCTGHDGSG